MDKINKLLERYFQGISSLEEERELKQYFASGNVANEHEPFIPLFEAFEHEVRIKKPISTPKVAPQQQATKRFWIKAFTYSGIAASILLAVWIQRPEVNDDYAVVSGRRIEDSEYAQKYAEKKLKKVNQILKNSMQPLRKLETVRQTLEPLHRINQETGTTNTPR